MKATQKIELLQQALCWAFSEGASSKKSGKKWRFTDRGCGCCSGDTEPPEELREVIVEALESAQHRGDEP